MRRYHGSGPAKCKSLYETSLLSSAQEKTLGALGPRKKLWGPWAHGLKRETLGALGPSDLSLMALALSFSCVVALCSVPSLMALAPGP